MALLALTNTVVINLPAIYRDVGWTPAETKNVIEDGFISSENAESVQFREKEFILRHKTCSDGYLLVYSFEVKKERTEFIEKLILLGLDLGSHISHGYCTWVCDLTISAYYKGEDFDVLAVSHSEDDRSNFKQNSPVLFLDSLQMSQFDGVKLSGAHIKTVLVSDDFVKYESNSMLIKAYYGCKSLFATSGEHVNSFRPPEFEITQRYVDSLTLCLQILPGVTSLVPYSEKSCYSLLDCSVDYLSVTAY
jgi:hypothetical protein